MTSSTDKPFHLIFITDEPDIAALVANAGVDRVMVDLEINGKIKRQGHLNTVISRHSPKAIPLIRERLSEIGIGEILVRVNPLHSGSQSEVDEVIKLGAQRLMLPMFRSREEVQAFIDLVDGRLPVTLLVETTAAYETLEDILEVDGEYDIHVGLNDLHLDMGLTFMFELLTNRVVDEISSACKSAGRKFGVGGVAPLSKAAKLSPKDILAYHKSVGSSGVILSRDWRACLGDSRKFSEEVKALRHFIAGPSAFDTSAISEGVDSVVKTIREN